ncbi:MAG: hypothetical protein QOG90_1078 [Actinomycetota bacterium]
MKRRILVIAATALVLCAATAAASAFFTPATVSSAGGVTTSTIAAPTSPSAVGGSSITLNWTATTSTYATGTRVLRGSASGGPYSQIALVTPRTTTTYVDYPPGPGTYYYVLQSYYQQWTSANSAQVSAARTTIAFVQSATAAGTTTTTATFTTTPVSGDLLVAVAATRNAGTITGPVGWTLAIDSGATSTPHQAIYYKVAGALESKSVAVATTASGTGNGLHVYELSGATTVRATGSATGSSTTPASGSVTPSVAYTGIIAATVANFGTGLSGWTNSFGEIVDFTAGSGGAKTLLAGAGVLATSAGTYSTTATNTTTGAWLGQIVAFG